MPRKSFHPRILPLSRSAFLVQFQTLLSRRWCASATSSFERAMFLTEADGDTARGDNAFLLFVSRTRRREGRHLVSPFERIRRLTKIGPNFRQFRIIHGPWRHLSLSLPLCGLTSGEEDGGGARINNTERATYTKRRKQGTNERTTYGSCTADRPSR